MTMFMGCTILFTLTGLWVLGLWKIVDFFGGGSASIAAVYIYIIATLWLLF